MVDWMNNSDKLMLAEYIDSNTESDVIAENTGFEILEIVNFRKDYEKAIKNDERDNFLGVIKAKITQNNSLEAIEGEDELKVELEKAAFSILFNLKNKVNAKSEIRDLKIASDIVSNLNNTLIAKNSPTVNIQNNIKSPNRYNNLLNDMVTINAEEES